MVDPVQLVTGTDWLHLVLGGGLFWLPGLTWAWALAGELGWLRWVPLSLVLAFTVQPFAMLAANLLLGVPITLGTTALLCVAVALAGLALGLREPVLERFAT